MFTGFIKTTLVIVTTVLLTTVVLQRFQQENTCPGQVRVLAANNDETSRLFSKPSVETSANDVIFWNSEKPRSRLLESNHTKQILYLNPAHFQQVRNIKNLTYFEKCKVNNCRMTFDPKKGSVSDAVIIDWRTLIYKPGWHRPRDQIWIFVQHEPPPQYWGPTTVFYDNMKKTFNWTMTYSKKADIYLPYGELKRKHVGELRQKRDYLEIARNKSKDAVWIVSNCATPGNRKNYVETLQKYIEVETLGACGTPWCGKAHDHELDDCFSVLNTSYRFYLAFENNLCEEYISEKFFENYKYDIIQVVRGGRPRTRPVDGNKMAYVSTSDFTNAHALGLYLKKLKQNVTHYAALMAVKDEYEAVSYQEMFQNAICQTCERLHNLDHHRQTYKDIYHWMQTQESCYYIRDF